jgi:hypothetical protein
MCLPPPLQFRQGVGAVVRADDRVPVEDGASSPAANLHDDAFGHAGVPEIPGGSSPQLVEGQAGDSRRLAAGEPRARKSEAINSPISPAIRFRNLKSLLTGFSLSPFQYRIALMFLI